MIGSPKRSALLSGLLHAVAIAVIVISAGVGTPPPATLRPTVWVATDLSRYLPSAPPKSHGGGGGGAGDATPATRGKLPRFAPRQFTPPAAVIRNFDPLLAMEPTLVGKPSIVPPNVNLPNYGDPAAPLGPPSGGRGRRGGIGDGDGGGVGGHTGPGYGDDDGGGVTATTGIRGSATAPVVLFKLEPEYTEDARRARIQGTVILRIEVDTNGRPRNISVRQSLGLGLDEQAMDAVRHWKFRPGRQNGRPVVTVALVEVNFRLL
ncbi:MAG TPA: energy transducer TonB [Bryobacteraceae bacterium]|nr:energy transducer TonB [Bryobacteraceae bacterium]